VSHLADFGAFVDLGGIDGLVHISELDWQHVNHPREVVKEGDEIEVYVLGVDRKKGHVRLSRRRLLPDPWVEVTSELRVGQVVEGTVRNVVDFGAFVDVGKGVEGLVHISEMSRGAETLSELQSDAQIQVRVLEIDQERRRIALSMRRTDYAAAILASSSWERSGDESSVD
jgi:small subunit ribosomal protein S1